MLFSTDPISVFQGNTERLSIFLVSPADCRDFQRESCFVTKGRSGKRLDHRFPGIWEQKTMTLDSEKLLESILKSLDRIGYLPVDKMPDIPLYVDQVTTILSDFLKPSTRYPGSDKILTRTMINNYAKNKLLPPPENKKYTKEHLIFLLFIYYYKGLMSIGDIQKLLSPLQDYYEGEKEGLELAQIYEEVFSLEKVGVEELKKQVIRQYKEAEKTFPDQDGEEGEFLRYFSFICMLSFDVFVKKLLIEKLVDRIPEPDKNAKKEKRTKEKNKPEKRK